jgi:hypothetical protein
VALCVFTDVSEEPVCSIFRAEELLMKMECEDFSETSVSVCVGVLINLWLFLFAVQAKEFFLDGLKKLEQRCRKCVWSSGGNM